MNKFSLFQFSLTIIILLIQLFFYREATLKATDRWKSKFLRGAIPAAFALFNIPLIGLLFVRVHVSELPSWFVPFAVYPFYVWHFSFFLLFLVYLLIALLRVIYVSFEWIFRKLFPAATVKQLGVTERPAGYDRQRRIFMRRGATLLTGAAFAGAVYGAVRKDNYETTYIRVPVDLLPESFDGFTIALISDIHSSVFMSKELMDQYAAAVNSLKADLIVVTGDFVNSQVEEVYPFAEAFSVLSAQYGVYGVLGNHDYYTRKVDVVAKRVDECGIRILLNENVLLQKNGDALYLMGVDDVGNVQRAGRLFDRALQGTKAGVPKLLLCHRPYFFEQAAARKIDITLSGHTHGGQIVLTRTQDNVIALARMASPYVAGLYAIASSHMYVSRGIGTVGIPVRINCPPEITKITLVNNSAV
ncbi:MAG TPA: metallophosphoesterase [Bacteroidota bacterium]|nr:metallophosphoesterase [Bacteroidota bacterium]